MAVTYGKWEEDSDSDSENEWGSFLEEPVDSRPSTPESTGDEVPPPLQPDSSQEEGTNGCWYEQCSPCPTPNLSVYQTADESTDEEQYKRPENPNATFRRSLSKGSSSFPCDKELAQALAKIRTQYASSESGGLENNEVARNFV